MLVTFWWQIKGSREAANLELTALIHVPVTYPKYTNSN